MPTDTPRDNPPPDDNTPSHDTSTTTNPSRWVRIFAVLGIVALSIAYQIRQQEFEAPLFPVSAGAPSSVHSFTPRTLASNASEASALSNWTKSSNSPNSSSPLTSGPTCLGSPADFTTSEEISLLALISQYAYITQIEHHANTQEFVTLVAQSECARPADFQGRNGTCPTQHVCLPSTSLQVTLLCAEKAGGETPCQNPGEVVDFSAPEARIKAQIRLSQTPDNCQPTEVSSYAVPLSESAGTLTLKKLGTTALGQNLTVILKDVVLEKTTGPSPIHKLTVSATLSGTIGLGPNVCQRAEF